MIQDETSLRGFLGRIIGWSATSAVELSRWLWRHGRRGYGGGES